jgi:hypothetical protein
VNLPVLWLNSFIYSVTLFYGFIWLINRGIESHYVWADRGLLVLGGYIAGISLSGAPLMVAVYMRHVSKYKLRDTLFVLWFILVSIKLTTFIAPLRQNSCRLKFLEKIKIENSDEKIYKVF